MKHFSAHILAWLALLPLAARAQAPTLTGSNPARHAAAAPRVGAAQFTFSQSVMGASDIKVFSNRWRGYRLGTSSGDGTTTLKVQPTQAFAPGEEVSVTVPATIRSATAGGQPLAGGQVVQFRAAAGPATGAFTSGTRLAESNTAFFDPTLADVNNDGRLDLLFTDSQSDHIALRLGDGLGSFGVHTRFATGGNPTRLVVADFNNDGNLDIMSAASNAAGRFLHIASGNGQGSFDLTQATVLPVAGLPLYAQAADVNADGNLDLVFEEWSIASSSTYSLTLHVYLGTGRGNFISQLDLPLDSGYGGLQLADVNNDGRLDCLTANSITGQLKTYLGNGLGGFALATTPALAISTVTDASYPRGYPVIAAVADFTADGNPDVLVVDAAANTVRLHPGNGQGEFQPAVATLTSTGLQQAFIADVEGDGDLDVLAPLITGSYSSTGAYTIKLWLNQGQGAFTPGTALPAPATTLAAGDVNNDGTTDIVALSAVGLGTASPAIYPHLGQPLVTGPAIIMLSGITATSGTPIVITGTNLAAATAVLVGGVPVASFTVNPDGTITFLPPMGTLGGLVTVVTPTGTATSAERLTITVLAARATANELRAELYPMPAHEAVQILLPATGPLHATFYNSLGQLVRTTVIHAQAGQPTTLSLAGITPGFYTLQLSTGNQQTNRQLVVK